MPVVKKLEQKAARGKKEIPPDADPQDVLKEHCREDPCKPYNDKLLSCNERVKSRTETTETCMEEVIDFMHCVDECVAKDLFTYLK